MELFGLLYSPVVHKTSTITQGPQHWPVQPETPRRQEQAQRVEGYIWHDLPKTLFWSCQVLSLLVHKPLMVTGVQCQIQRRIPSPWKSTPPTKTLCLFQECPCLPLCQPPWLPANTVTPSAASPGLQRASPGITVHWPPATGTHPRDTRPPRLSTHQGPQGATARPQDAWPSLLLWSLLPTVLLRSEVSVSPAQRGWLSSQTGLGHLRGKRGVGEGNSSDPSFTFESKAPG